MIVSSGDSYIGKFSIFMGNGDGTFQPQVDTNFLNGVSTTLAIGDFNRDGFIDFISDDTNGIHNWTGDRTGNFTETWSYTRSDGGVYTGDFNRDGIADLSIVNGTFNYVQVLTGNGDGTFEARGRYSIGQVASDVAVGDINNDGLDDVVTSNFASNEVSVLIASGNAQFYPATNYVSSAQSRGITIGDFNGDDRTDIVTTGSRVQVPSGSLQLPYVNSRTRRRNIYCSG